MGLRMYRDPDEVESKPSTVKTDPTAAARSAIRRQRSVRYSPNTRLPSMPTISSSPYRSLSTSGRTRTSSDRQWLLEDIRRRETALDHLSRNAAAAHVGRDVEVSHHGSSFVRSMDPASNRISQQQRRGDGRSSTGHVFISEHTNDRISLARDSTVPRAPELHNPQGMMPMSMDLPLGSAIVDASRASHWPLLPYTSGGSSGASPISQPIPSVRPASLTPRFAPAYRFSSETDEDGVVAGQSFTTRQESLAILAERLPSPEEAINEEDRVFLSMFASHLETMRRRSPETLTTPYLTAEAAYLRNIEQRLNYITVSGMAETRASSVDDLPPLRRMTPEDNANRRAAVLRQNRRTRNARMRNDGLDGLGDRQRSFSSDDENWETMLTTITPDERVPSAHSSFTTATASATSQSSNSMESSYGTLVTVPSNEPESETCPAEDSDSSESNSLGATNRDMTIEDAQDLHRQARSRHDRYQSRLANLVDHPPRRAHQAQIRESSHDIARREAHRAELHMQLQRLENELEVLNRDIAEDRAFERQRPEERL